MDKIGIVTLQGRSNYGNRLQNYACTYLYEKRGFAVESLLYTPNESVGIKLKNVLKTILGRRAVKPEELMSKDRLDAFDRFNSHMSFRAVHGVSSNIAEEYRYFSVGSDQVWNLGRGTLYDDWYFLRFANYEQRIALSPSIGLDVIDKGLARRLGVGVLGFKHLSVRENRGAEIIRECSGRNAVVLCDPTMGLSREEWLEVSDNRLTPREPFVFAYVLGAENGEACEVFDLIKETHGPDIKIIRLSDKERQGEIPAGPAEFISLIHNAQHVITDSFHAAVFSSIFQTPLTIIHREGGAAMFSRLETLSERLGIEDKIYGTPSFDFSQSSDYSGVAEAIASERNKLESYLGCCLGR